MNTNVAEVVVALLVDLASGTAEPDPSARLDEAGIDSLTVIEMVVHLEAHLDRPVPDGAVALLQEDARIVPSMSIAECAAVVADLLGDVDAQESR